MQPAWYDLQCPAAKDNGSAHTAAAPRNLVAAITMRSAETELKNTIGVRTVAAEIVVPQPDLGAKEKNERFLNRRRSSAKTKKYLLPKRHRNFDAATPLRFTTPSCKKMIVQYYVRSRRDKQPWCNHYSAICAGKWQHACIYEQPNWSTIPQTAHCDLRGANLGTTSIAATTSRASCPLSLAATTAEHRGGTKKGQNEHGRSRFTHELPFIAGSGHYTRKNTVFRAPASSSTQVPCNVHAAITMHFAPPRGKPACIYLIACGKPAGHSHLVHRDILYEPSA